MLNKKITTIFISIILVCSLVTVSFARVNTKAYNDIKQIIERFYDLSYDIFIDFEMKDISSVLNKKSKFGRNYISYIKNSIVENKYYMLMGYSEFKLRRLAILVSILDIKIEGNNAIVKVNVGGDNNEAYPMFICLGENTFNLKKNEGHWLIESIQTDDKLFKLLNENEFKEEKEEEVYDRIDEENGIKKGERYSIITKRYLLKVMKILRQVSNPNIYLIALEEELYLKVID
ncbi:hypothetical protein HMPREF1142_1264 [Peptostreptococcaceae bacterium AS15]|nr:hypothetical protein HMPREF1142_1264 [Peptostreptococcaceae bacterium AS15]